MTNMFLNIIKQKESNMEYVEVNSRARYVIAKRREEREDDDNDSFNEIINKKLVILRRISQVYNKRNSTLIDKKRGRTYNNI